MGLIATIQSQPNGIAAPDLTQRATRLSFTTNEHGFESGALSAPLSLTSAFNRYDRPGLPHMLITDGAAVAFQGRVEDTTIRGDGIDLTALGYSQAFKDIPYSAMWSVTRVNAFTPQWLASTANGPSTNRWMTIDATNGIITIGLVKNTLFTPAWRGEMAYRIPDDSSRNVQGFMVDYDFLASANVTLRISSWANTYPFSGFSANDFSLVGNGATQRGAVFLGANTPVITFGLEAALHNYTGETGAEYVKFSNIRLVSFNNAASSSLTVARTNGSPVTVTVGSTSWMYVGQRVWLNGGGKSETTVVISIPSSTTFTANVVNAPGGGYPIGTTVAAWIVHADHIVKDLLSTVRGINSTQLAAATTLIQSPGIDLLDETYEDRSMADILDYLITTGDTNSTPRRWRWGVYDDQKLFFWPEGTNAKAWYVDITDLELQKTVTNLINSVYAIYQGLDGPYVRFVNGRWEWFYEPNNQSLRTAISANSASITRYGLTRRSGVQASTTNANVAATIRNAALADTATPPPRFGITFQKVYNAAGAVVPPWMPRAGDTITIRNLPPTVSVEVDRLRTFRIARTSCDLIARTLTVEPTTPLPSVNALLAKVGE